MGLRHAAGLLGDLLYPPVCPICEKLLPPGTVIHKECMERLRRVGGPRCPVCGRPVNDGARLCPSCRERRPAYAEGSGLFYYEGRLKDAVGAWKFRGRRRYASAFGFLMAAEGEAFIRRQGPDCIVPVPMHPEKKRRRGYDQTEDLAQAVSRLTKIPVRGDLLARVAATEAMKELTPAERRKNIRAAFAKGSGDAAGLRILLIDDIFTTGATADACAGTLLQAGASEVRFLALCTGGGDTARY